MLLSTLKAGDKAKICKILIDCPSSKRLIELGLNKGANIKIVKNDRGPMIIGLSGSKLAISKCLSNHVVVKLCK